MSLKKILVIFALFVLILVAFFFIFPKFRKDRHIENLPASTPSIEDRIKEKFNNTIPDDMEKIELQNVSDKAAMGIATKEGVYADLPDLAVGENYQVLITNGKNTITLGNLSRSKGGYILEYDLSKYPGYNTIFVTKGGEHILEGSF